MPPASVALGEPEGQRLLVAVDRLLEEACEQMDDIKRRQFARTDVADAPARRRRAP